VQINQNRIAKNKQKLPMPWVGGEPLF
jgi:hypothetical protein